MTWHGQINRTIWEIEHRLEKQPKNYKLRRELLRTHFLQRYEYDRSLHIPRDDRSFLFLQEDRAPAALLIHGAHGTPAEMRDLGNFLYGKGLSVYCPRLSRYDLKNRLVTWESWVTMAQNSLTTVLQYTKHTLLIGLSLGGTVSMVLERLHPVKGMVLLAPAVYPKLGLKSRMYEVVRRVTPTLFYRFAGWNGEAIKAMEHVRKTSGDIASPTLVLQARDDHVISAKGLKFIDRWTTSEKSESVLLKKGSHALTRGESRQEVFDRILGFAKNVQALRSRR